MEISKKIVMKIFGRKFISYRTKLVLHLFYGPQEATPLIGSTEDRNKSTQWNTWSMPSCTNVPYPYTLYIAPMYICTNAQCSYEPMHQFPMRENVVLLFIKLLCTAANTFSNASMHPCHMFSCIHALRHTCPYETNYQCPIGFMHPCSLM